MVKRVKNGLKERQWIKLTFLVTTSVVTLLEGYNLEKTGRVWCTDKSGVIQIDKKANGSTARKFKVWKLFYHLILQSYLDCDCQPLSNAKDIRDEYKGKVSRTKSGYNCQNWNKDSPHDHDNHIGNHNYCRNPDGEPGGMWCYTTNPDHRWEYCKIDYCKNNGGTLNGVKKVKDWIVFANRENKWN